MLPHKTDQTGRGISRDRYLFCLPADREDVSDAEGAAYGNEKGKEIRSFDLLVIRAPVDPQMQNTWERRLHLGYGSNFIFFEVSAMVVLAGFHIRHSQSLHAHEYLWHYPLIVV